mmetsp:Transcript_3679/g.15268  ORF Transcript_3679/g.15268 Transcript_3679/m.15268 type:complete len:650 (+) Transcript_3679:3878-5827(+)
MPVPARRNPGCRAGLAAAAARVPHRRVRCKRPGGLAGALCRPWGRRGRGRRRGCPNRGRGGGRPRRGRRGRGAQQQGGRRRRPGRGAQVHPPCAAAGLRRLQAASRGLRPSPPCLWRARPPPLRQVARRPALPLPRGGPRRRRRRRSAVGPSRPHDGRPLGLLHRPRALHSPRLPRGRSRVRRPRPASRRHHWPLGPSRRDAPLQGVAAPPRLAAAGAGPIPPRVRGPRARTPGPLARGPPGHAPGSRPGRRCPAAPRPRLGQGRHGGRGRRPGQARPSSRPPGAPGGSSVRPLCRQGSPVARSSGSRGRRTCCLPLGAGGFGRPGHLVRRARRCVAPPRGVAGGRPGRSPPPRPCHRGPHASRPRRRGSHEGHAHSRAAPQRGRPRRASARRPHRRHRHVLGGPGAADAHAPRPAPLQPGRRRPLGGRPHAGVAAGVRRREGGRDRRARGPQRRGTVEAVLSGALQGGRGRRAAPPPQELVAGARHQRVGRLGPAPQAGRPARHAALGARPHERPAQRPHADAQGLAAQGHRSRRGGCLRPRLRPGHGRPAAPGSARLGEDQRPGRLGDARGAQGSDRQRCCGNPRHGRSARGHCGMPGRSFQRRGRARRGQLDGRVRLGGASGACRGSPRTCRRARGPPLEEEEALP